MVASDIAAAASLLREVHDASDGLDGFVSVEVSPELAHDSSATSAAARELRGRIAAPNLYVKIPGTVEGLTAIEEAIAGKLSVNVTLIFGVARYRRVAEAYISGLERADGDLGAVSSVASFFVSRIDTAVDRLLERIGTDEALALRGRAAIATAKEAYAGFLRAFSGPRWEALAARGARPQRLLWASTSAKNPSYPDTVYVDELIGPRTVTTLPDSTLLAFEDHGTVSGTLRTGLDESRSVLEALERLGVDMGDVSRRLEDEGVAAFTRSFSDLLDMLGQESSRISGLAAGRGGVGCA